LRIGLVPTMGALHEGHLSLIRKAREQCDVVVVSVFVNPTQFNERADLDAYPRRTDSDRKLAAKAGADIVFAPAVQEIYPPGFDTSVAVGQITTALEGALRGAGHFSGVATVVLKLLNLTTPDVAYFGQKDAQQVIVIRKLVRDLNVGVRIETCPTVREFDGLAMSSRNARLSSAERARAIALHRGLVAACELAATGAVDAEDLLACARSAMAELEVVPEYLALVNPETLEPVTKLKQPGLLLVAARVGDTRLIDNTEITPTVPLRLAHATEREAALCSA
jgi:pantoate--beta-alanine ligase